MSAHSPGPWRVDPDHQFHVIDANGNEVCELARSADGPIIEAAPELLAALKLALQDVHDLMDLAHLKTVREHQVAAEAIIARIEARNITAG